MIFVVAKYILAPGYRGRGLEGKFFRQSTIYAKIGPQFYLTIQVCLPTAIVWLFFLPIFRSEL